MPKTRNKIKWLWPLLLVAAGMFSDSVWPEGAASGLDATIEGSGARPFAKGRANRAGADTYPVLPGAYASSAQHPRVFTTQDDLNNLVRRINSPNSFSQLSFGRLAKQVEGDLASKVDWQASYTGCDIDIYLHAFSYESRTGYVGETRTEKQFDASMNTRQGLASPAGAAIVASRSALYAALLKAGATAPAGAAPADQAVALARAILLSWANHGFRDAKGKLFGSPSQFCNGDGKSGALDVGLQIGRGVIYSVQAQDLLQSLEVLSAAETAQVNAFHSSMFDVIRQASNLRFDAPYQACERYSNHSPVALTGLLAISRLQDDARKFNAVLYGVDRSIPVSLPWITQFNHSIYGEADAPVGCYPNPGPDSLTSKPSYQTAAVAPGEVEDRYRNANPEQGIGYPMFTLEHLFNAAEILKHAGIDAYAYRGSHRQSLEMATQYYACYGRNVGFRKVITADNAKVCPNNAQYIGKVVNDVETIVLPGAYRFPKNAAITELDAAAKAEAARDPLDTLRFGLWPN